MDAHRERRHGPWWSLVLALLLILPVPWLLADAGGDGDGDSAHPAMLAVAPEGTVAVDELPADHAALYHRAAADADVFTQVRCYCGCEDFLDHVSLHDCFVRPDGAWERHATGCAVCLAEAEEVAEALDAGLPLDEIVTRIDDRYGRIVAAT